MSNYSTLKASIDANIRKNGRQLITGPVLNSVLTAMVNSLGAGYQFAGVASEDTNPGSPDYNLFYIAGPGDYEEIGEGISINEGNIGIIKYDGEWTVSQIAVGSPNVVQYVEQVLTEAQKEQARNNISAMAEDGMYVKVTWAELKSLKDEGKLVPGTWYRITDYVATTIQAETRSANHPFDILVLATDTGDLSEDAKAIQHDNDGYFDECDLSAWKVSYCLENDDRRFAWADTENGKGVIFRLVDEWGNDCPYDFKGIQFLRSSSWFSEHETWAEDVLGSVPEEDVYYYTFSWVNEDGEIEDLSIVGQLLQNDEGQYSGVFGNTIKEMSEYSIGSDDPTHARFALSKNVCVSSYLYEDGVFYGCYSNTFGNGCRTNTFGNDCGSNTFGNDCYHNTFGNNCYSNTFGNDCYHNTFGNGCGSNTFGNNCYYNTFGNNCGYNTFGNGCGSNTFGNNCYYNTFGNDCYHNTFGNDCGSNTFGNDCYHNTFGNNFQYGTLFEGVIYLNVTGSTSPVKYCTILSGTQGTSSSNRLTISFVANKNYPQFAGKTTSGTLKIWNPVDLV